MNDTRPPTVSAAFADAAQADRAIDQLRQRGIAAEAISVEHGATAAPGRTAAEDRAVADRIAGSWATGAAVGALVGALLGALVGVVAFEPFGSGFWALVLGAGGAGGGVGALWGMFAGFTGRGRQTRDLDTHRRPPLRDAVQVHVATDVERPEVVRGILVKEGGRPPDAP